MGPQEKFNALLQEYNPEFLNDFGALSTLARDIVDTQTQDEHFKLIQERTLIVWETFTGVITLISLDLIVSGFAHCRTVYENVLSTLHLLHDKKRVENYLDHAKVLSFELNEVLGRDPRELDVVRAEYQAIKPKFLGKNDRPLNWHKMSIAKLAEAVDIDRSIALGEGQGFFPYMQKTFYKQASSLAHGEGFLGMHYGKEGWYYDVKNYELSGLDVIALNFSYSIVTMLCESIIRHFGLPFDKELAHINEINKKRLTGEDKNQETGL